MKLVYETSDKMGGYDKYLEAVCLMNSAEERLEEVINTLNKAFRLFQEYREPFEKHGLRESEEDKLERILSFILSILEERYGEEKVKKAVKNFKDH